MEHSCSNHSARISANEDEGPAVLRSLSTSHATAILIGDHSVANHLAIAGSRIFGALRWDAEVWEQGPFPNPQV